MTDQEKITEFADWDKLSSNPLVSVYMLAYRHEKFIAQAIDGIIAQQCDFPIELIIGEDCSPDRTREIALNYQRRYPHIIRVLTASKNVGAYANGRRCQLATRGKYVALCEGDDFWHHPRKLQMQVDLMSSHQSMTACHTDFDRLTKHRLRRHLHKSCPSQWLAQGDAYIALLHEWSVMTATCMFRRNIIMSFIGSAYDNPAWPFGDRNKLLFASLHGTFGYVDESTATFRKRMGSATNSGPLAALKMARATLECIELFLLRHPPDNKTRHLALRNVYLLIYRAAFRAGDVEQMNHAFVSLSTESPPPSRWLHRLRCLAVRAHFPIHIRNVIRAAIDRYISAMY